jgi:uncharacterized protein (DUF305 family)
MQTKPLLYGLIGFFIGGFLVALAATTFDKPATDMNSMATSLKDKNGDQYDEAFIDMMIEHHQAAIDMANLSSKRAKHDEIKQHSRDIIAVQEKEIHQMKQWQAEWGYGPAAHDNGMSR